MSQEGKKAVRTTLVVTLVVFASKGVGFVRDMICAAYFGTGMEYDAYVSAYGLFYLPVLLFSSCITSTLIPLYIDARRNAGIRAADRFASNSINLFAIAGMAVSVVMMALAWPLVRVVYPGFTQDKLALTADLTRLMLPSLTFVTVSLTMASILNARDRYVAAQLTGFPLSVAMILATVLLSARFGIRALAWGVFGAGILQALILVPSLSKALTYSFRVRPRDKRFKRLTRLAVPGMLSMAVNELNHLIDRSLASGLNTGDISAMNYAYRLITFALGVLVVPVNTVMFSRMSACAAGKDYKGVKQIVMECFEAIVMLVAPIVVIGGALSREVIELVYQRGRFDAQSTLVTSAVFTLYLVGMPGFALRDMFNRAFHSLQDTRTPMLMACVSVTFNIVLNIILSRFMGVGGLALATSISCAVGAMLLLYFLRRRLGRLGMRKAAAELVKIALASAAAFSVAYLMRRAMPWSGTIALLGKIILIVGVAGCAYVAALALMKARQLRYFAGLLLGGRKHGGGGR